MLTEVNICNIALSHLGDMATVASIDPPEGSAQAEHCANFYPIARNSMLSFYDWAFARRRVELTAVQQSSLRWKYSYAKPVDMLNLIEVVCPRARRIEFAVESDGNNQYVLTNEPHSIAIYTAEIKDPTRFPPLFVEALTWQLSSMLAGPLIKSDVGAAEAKRCAESAQLYLQRATFNDANQNRFHIHHETEWLRGR